MKKFYLPILKAKAGEFTALKKLDPSIKSWVYPMFEITQIEYDNETDSTANTVEEHLVKLVKKITNCWGHNKCFVDVDLIKNETILNQSALEGLYSLLAINDIYPTPVARLNMPESLSNGIVSILGKHAIKEIAIRITIEDIDSPDFEEELNRLLGVISVSPDNCHMVFDLMDSDFSEIENFSDGIVGIIDRFPYMDNWKSFTLAGGSFPVTGKLKEGQQQIPRGDWSLYKTVVSKLVASGMQAQINFGDYSIVAPGHFTYDPIKMQTSANIRYTHNNSWLVIKGKSLKLYGYNQYFDISRTIKNSTFFLGQNYSEGDNHLFKCSPGVTTTGNPQTWKWVGNNHHITKVVNDLFSNPSDS